MTVDLPISRSFDDAHQAGIDEVNRWRGRCIQCFAYIELAAATALAGMAARDPASSKKVSPLFGSRIQALRDAFREGEPFHTRGKKAAKALDELQPCLEFRNILVHSVGHVYVAPAGHWIWSYRVNADGKADQSGTICSDQAKRLERELAAGSRKLSDLLRNLISHSPPAEAVTE